MKAVAALVALVLLVAVECSVIPYNGYYGYAQYFHGYYPGKCADDGMYYNDDASFVVCTNGNAYVQRCAPGTRNGPYAGYHVGSTYSHSDFCGVNLNDLGYSAYQHAYPHHNGYRGPYPYYW